MLSAAFSRSSTTGKAGNVLLRNELTMSRGDRYLSQHTGIYFSIDADIAD